jgi:S-adenosylmethionine:tRNA ribosyltransferase-isomerase
VEIEVNLDPSAFDRWLDEYGFVPLPPYITRADPKPVSSSDDTAWYQTVYARQRGSVAAPTAGLHFSEDLLASLRARGIETAEVTLHVGAGTFLPVRSSNIDEHVMHEERFSVPRHTLSQIVRAHDAGRPIVVVGTTTMRCLESFARTAGRDPIRMGELADQLLRTSLFLRPRHRKDTITPWIVRGIMTNFHQPQSTLFMLISALIGLDEAHRLYQEAIREQYRLFSYGDSCLLWLSSPR